MNQIKALLPRPVSIQQKSGSLRITAGFSLRIEEGAGERAYQATTRFQKRLADKTGLFFEAGSALDPVLLVRYERAGKLALHEDESYAIEVTKDQAIVNAVTDFGIMRGLETLLQLIEADQEGYFIHAVEVYDKPRFPWRGLMIDCARRFQPMDVLKRNIDGMAAVKLNVFHWHLTDDQGFRVESKVFPRLHGLGANGEYYT